MRRTPPRAALVLVGWGLMSSPASAHGPPPFVLGVAAAGADGPRVLVVTEGLVQRRAERWHFVCPSRFGSDPSPIALSADGERTFVVGDEDLHALEADGSSEPLGVPDLRRRFVVSLVDIAGRIHAVWFSATSSEIRALDGAAALWSTPERIQAAFGDEYGMGAWVGTVSEETGRALHVDLSGSLTGASSGGATEQPSGTVTEERTFAVDPSEAITALTAVEGDVFVALVDLDFEARLLRLRSDGRAPVLVTASEPFRGLAPAQGGELWTASDGVLFRTQQDEAFSMTTDEPVTCVGQLGTAPHACAGTRLYRLGRDGLGAPLADLADLEGPEALPTEPAAAERCRLEWATFRDDLAAIGVLAVTDEPADATAHEGARTDPLEGRSSGSSSSGGCRMTPAPRGHDLLAWWPIAAFALRRRSRVPVDTAASRHARDFVES